MFQPSAFDESCSAPRGEFSGFETWYCADADDFWCLPAHVTPEAKVLDSQAFLDLEVDVPY